MLKKKGKTNKQTSRKNTRNKQQTKVSKINRER
jgi:hypothetical protein